MSVSTSNVQPPVDPLSSGDTLIGMAALGKTAAALALVIAIILLCTSLLKRWQQHRFDQGARLRIVGNTAVGSRERIVVVEVEDTWLVLGVCNGRISKLHERPAPANRTPTPEQPPSRFSQRLANALAQSRGKSDSPPSDSHRPS